MGKPGCVRSERFKYQCDKRIYDEGKFNFKRNIKLNSI